MLLSLFIIPLVTAYHQGNYHFYSFNYFTDLAGFYESNFQFLDFILYLALIGGAAKVVFQRRFGASSAAGLLSVGMAGLISGALVWWEAQRGESLIMIIGNVAGSWFLWILVILALLGLYVILRTYFGVWRSIAIMIGIAVIALIGSGISVPEIPVIPRFLANLIDGIVPFLIAAFWILLVIWIFRYFYRRGGGVSNRISNIPEAPGSDFGRELARDAALERALERHRQELENLIRSGRMPEEEGERRLRDIERREREVKMKERITEEEKLKRREIPQRLALPPANIFTGSRLTDPRQKNAFLNRVLNSYISKYSRIEGQRRFNIFLQRFRREEQRYRNR